MATSQLSVVIPALNEEAAVSDTVTRILSLAKDESWLIEVIVIDDGSTDATAERARAAGATVIRHPTNGGYGLSLQHGIRAAKYDAVAISDADGTYPIEELPALYEMVMKQGYDMAVGARTGEEYRRGWWKYPARIMFRWLAEYVAGRTIPDINSGLRVFRRSTVLQYLPHTCLGFSFTTSITLILFLNGYFVGYRPISYAKRLGSTKVRHLRDTLRTAQILVSVIAKYNPIKLFLLAAVWQFAIGLMFYLISSWWTTLSVISVVALGWMCLAPLTFAIGPALESRKD